MKTVTRCIAAAAILLAALPSHALTRYVDVNSTNPVAPYTNWVTAANVIQDAVDAADPGDEVLVTNGVYATGGKALSGIMTNRVAVDKPLMLLSVNGPEFTIIQGYQVPVTTNGDGAIRCVYLTNAAILSGFTLTNGATRGSGDATQERSGGGAWCESTNVRLSNCILVGNAASWYGGGAHSGTLDDSTLANNSAYHGGGLYGGILNNSSVSRNAALSRGGGAYLSILNSCTISSNSAAHGGGVHSGVQNGCAILGNIATLGGGVHSGTLSGCLLLTNSAESGGASYKGTLEHCVIRGNSATNNSGGAYVSGGGGVHGSTLTYCELTGNVADWGGASSGSDLEYCTLSGNYASSYGGGAYGGTLISCRVIGNYARLSGGGARSSSCTKSTFRANSAPYGGGVYSCILGSCSLSSNSAIYWGGGAHTSSLNNCTITGNTAGEKAGGTYDCELTNSIVYYNLALSAQNYEEGTLEYCCTMPDPEGVGNISIAPMFVSAVHIAADSPCVGAGNHAYTSGKDIDGEPWRNPPTMGADEPFGTNAGPLSVEIESRFSFARVGFEIPLVGIVEGAATESAWNFGDGTSATNQAYTSHGWTVPGIYEVVFTAWNTDYPEGVASTNLITVVEGVYYVDASNTTPMYPYTNWVTAATLIQDAVSAQAAPGRLVRVTNGLYNIGGLISIGQLTNRVVLTDLVTVQSVNGPETTIIEGHAPLGDGAVRCAYVAAGSLLSGFTLTNGATLTNGDWILDQSGGGAWCEMLGRISNCIITGNVASQRGGGVYAGILTSCEVRENLADYGGGAYSCNLTNCTLEANTAEYGGGVAGKSLVENCFLIGNQAAYGGGCLWSVFSHGCRFEANSANFGGAAAGGELTSCLLLDNTATNSGGGVYQASVSDSKLIRNTALHWGGGAQQGSLTRCVLIGNSADLGGGAYDSTMSSSAIIGNTAVTDGGGTYQSRLNNCTLTENSSSQSAGGAYQSSLTNCIVYYNTAPAGSNYSGGTLQYCCSAPLAPGIGNILNQPGLLSPSHLAPDSPCVSAGDTLQSPASDIDGEPWRAPPSIGADEPYGTSTGSLSVEFQLQHEILTAGYEMALTAEIFGTATSSQWSFGDGIVITNRAYISHAWSIPGIYKVVLTAWNADHPSGVSHTNVIAVVDGLYYVDASNPNPVPPYTSWTTAATNIQDAIDAEPAPGRVVWVTNGVYESGGVALYGAMTNRVALVDPVSVQSVNGPAVTVIKGQEFAGGGAVRCAYVGSNAMLSGFTLTNGGTLTSGDTILGRSGGGVMCESGGGVFNCLLVGNSASRYGGGAYSGRLVDCLLTNNNAECGGGMSEGALSNCIVTGNFASQGGGAGYKGTIDNSTLEGNSATDGGGTYQSVLNNCVVTRNSASRRGGGAYSSTMDNCVVTGNSASQDAGGAFSGKLNNCILYYNVAPSGSNYLSGTLRHCCAQPEPAGTGNISSEPRMVSTSRIAENSPCVGAGSQNYSAGFDVDGEPWRNPPSIGADEPYGTSAGPLIVRITAPYSSVSVGFALPLAASIEGPVTASVWDFDDDSMATNQAYQNHTWHEPGVYEVVLTASNADHPEGVSATNLITVVDTAYYVDLANSTSLAPYTNWATAATNIQDAVSAARTPGRMIWVADGIYDTGGHARYSIMTNRVVLTNFVTVQSVNGPEVTVIKGQGPVGNGAVRCAYVSSDCLLSGFTLTNGATLAGGDSLQGRSGGGVFCEAGGVLSNCVVVGNSASMNGGGACQGSLIDCIVRSNSASSGGGAYLCTLSTSILNGNSASGEGGGSSHGTLQHCTLNGNSAHWGGGDARSFLANCVLIGNSATNEGGGSYYGSLINCSLKGNFARTGGGSSSSGLTNCVLTANSATVEGGGAFLGMLINCTASGNSASNRAGGTSFSYLKNSIVYYNAAPAAPNYLSSTLSYCCTTPLGPYPGAGGNFTAKPGFLNTNGWSDLRLAPGSLCINGGENEAWMQSAIDRDGWPRILGGQVDIGAYESVDGRTTNGIAAGWLLNHGLPTDGSADWFDPDGDRQSTYSEYIADTNPTNKASVLRIASLSHVPPVSICFMASSNRVYTLQVKAGVAANDWVNVPEHTGFQGFGSMLCLEHTNVAGNSFYRIQVEWPDTHYVWKNSPSPNWPYTNWVSAAHDIQSAINASVNGGTVWVTNGTYDTGGWIVHGLMPNRIALTKPVTVKSVNGPEVTVISGQGPNGNSAVRCAYVGNGAMLGGFTLSGGATRTTGDNTTEKNGGGVWCEASGVVSNCLVVGNSAESFGGGVAYGTVCNSVISSNIGGTGGGVTAAKLVNCQIIGNSASDSYAGGAYSSTLRNCTVAGNTSPYIGSGTTVSTLYNCIVVHNTQGGSIQNHAWSTLYSCCTTPLPSAGSGNITNAPFFVNTNNWSDLRLQSNSPCINAGNNANVSSDVDLDGNPRIVGGTVDMGAYEFQSPQSVISYAWLQQYGLPTDGSVDNLDQDNDRATTWQECKMWTNPTNQLSVLRMLSPQSETSGTMVSWESVAGHSYFLERSTNASAPFSLLKSNIAGLAGTTSFTDTNEVTEEPVLYRVGVPE